MAMTDLAPSTERPVEPERQDPPAVDETGREAERLAPGTKVEVRSRLEARKWSRGFEVAQVTERGYRLRRLSDGAVVPVELGEDEVRAERRRGTWWY